jgi:hypothetical protein
VKTETAPKTPDHRLVSAGFERVYRMSLLVPGDPSDGTDGDFLWRDPADDAVLEQWQATERLVKREAKGKKKNGRLR